MQCGHDPLYDIDPRTGADIEVFYADRALETFGGADQVGSGASPARPVASGRGDWSC